MKIWPSSWGFDYLISYKYSTRRQTCRKSLAELCLLRAGEELTCRTVVVYVRPHTSGSHFFTNMNEEQTIKFVYIAGQEHGIAHINNEQLNQIIKILYG